MALSALRGTINVSQWNNKPTDMRKVRQRQERLLVIAVVGVLLVAGGLTIGIVYGWQSVVTGLLCLIPGAVGLVLIWLVLRLIEGVLDRWD